MEMIKMSELINSEAYPTKEQLKKIRFWNKEEQLRDPEKLIDFIRPLWYSPKTGVILSRWINRKKCIPKRYKRLTLHTYGSCGNENIIIKLKKTIFWDLFWEKSTRGGHHSFLIREITELQR